MTDNPFDAIAVKAAAEALEDASVQRMAQTIERANAALTAACKSMKERGRARTIPNFVLLDGLKPDTATVTIFRHGE